MRLSNREWRVQALDRMVHLTILGVRQRAALRSIAEGKHQPKKIAKACLKDMKGVL